MGLVAYRKHLATRFIAGGLALMSDTRHRRLEIEHIGDVTVVNFIDEKIDEQNIQAIGEELFHLVNQLGRRKILLNLDNVEYLSSAALGKFISLHKKLNSLGGRLILCNIDPEIDEVFDITELKHTLPTGVQAAGLPADPFLAEAFRRGRAAYWASLAVAVALVLLVAVLLLDRLLRWGQ
jgi:anti-sigma B factor antagonist